MFFIHKYTDGAIVKFTRTPQVRHKNTSSLAGAKVGSYIRTITGRIAKVKNIYQKKYDISKYGQSGQFESLNFFSIEFLDNKEILELEPNNTMTFVKVGIINLFFYNLLIPFFKGH